MYYKPKNLSNLKRFLYYFHQNKIIYLIKSQNTIKKRFEDKLFSNNEKSEKNEC